MTHRHLPSMLYGGCKTANQARLPGASKGRFAPVLATKRVVGALAGVNDGTVRRSWSTGDVEGRASERTTYRQPLC